MLRKIAVASALLALAGCATRPAPVAPVCPACARRGADPRLQRLPRQSRDRRRAGRGDRAGRQQTQDPDRRSCEPGGRVDAACAQAIRIRVTVSAGDLIGASPLISAYFLDEPTIHAMNLLGLESQFGRQSRIRPGQRRAQADAERRMREVHDAARPARSSRSAARAFRFLAANVLQSDGSTIFPGDRDQALRPDHARLHRHDAEGHAQPRHARPACRA